MTLTGNGRDFRAATTEDEGFLFEVFCSAWEREALALPDPGLVRHFLRIQYTSQQDRLGARFPRLGRHVVTDHGKPVGYLLLQDTAASLQLVDLALLPAFRDAGLGTEVVRELMWRCGVDGRPLGVRVDRRSERAGSICERLGFRLVAVDDHDTFYEWTCSADRGTTSSHSVP
jgi:ribosomal protein S18 acetylase RimI-like enzyme